MKLKCMLGFHDDTGTLAWEEDSPWLTRYCRYCGKPLYMERDNIKRYIKREVTI